MKTKHTQGQWIKGTNTAKRDWMKIYSEGKLIAEVKELSKKGERKATDFEEEGANAQLIMYAPELLQMVKSLKDCIKRLTNDTEMSQYDIDCEAEWIGEAHELLHKINPNYYQNANQQGT
jgi:hypothetical protein